MLSFLGQFSDSFLLALLAWPFIAGAVTLPILMWQYRRYNKLTFTFSALVYSFILYLLGLASFTLYPMPDNPTQFCSIYNISPQLIPFTFISDFSKEGMRAVLQVVMNIAFFVPLGAFGSLLFRWKFWPVLFASLGVSLFIETAQLTGAFWLYPCSYRLFDVDDLMFNTLGSLIGFGLASLIPKKERLRAERGDIVARPGMLRRLVGFGIDQMAVWVTSVVVALVWYFIAGKDTAFTAQPYIDWGVLTLIHFVLPLTWQGKTVGGVLVRMSLDDRPRSPWRRALYYALRLAFIAGILYLPHGFNILLIIVAGVVWLRWKRMVYSI